MRPHLFWLALPLGLSLGVQAQTCTGLCLQQMACPAGQTTSITGTVYAPNGVDPLPNVIVYIPNAPVEAFTPGVSCPAVGQPPSGSPLLGTTTAVDGTFKLTNVPVGASIPLVIQTGRWRRQLVVPVTTACTDTAFSTRMPRNQTEGDIPKFAIATGNSDQVECVLRKVGIDDSEFTDPTGTGRINLFSSEGNPGARVSAATPSASTLMSTPAAVEQYDVLMLPCEGAAYGKTSAELASLIQFANAGGRVYSSHFSYVWMYQNPPFDGVANWTGRSTTLPDGIATVDTSFAEGQILAQWLQLTGASTTLGQIPVSTVKHDFNGVNPPTQSWLTLNNAAAGNPVMQFVFNTPVGNTTNQCGRVLYNEYHVENPLTPPRNVTFPLECPSTAMTPQEKLLEYSVFELTDDGNAATLSPTSQDFGTEAINFNSNPQSFTWTNNSTFPASVSTLKTSGDFNIASSNCDVVAPGASCRINVVFKPTAVGARTGTLTVGTTATTLTATLTGTGIADLAVSFASLDFGNLDVGASAAKTISVVNNAPGPVAVPPLLLTGDYKASSTCGSVLGSLATCAITVTFTPGATGSRPGTIALNSSDPAYPAAPTTLSGNGVDFTLTDTTSSGTVIAGYNTSVSTLTTPIAGFAAPVTLSCTINAVAATCTPSLVNFVPVSPVTATVSITTTAQYTVVGYGGVGGGWGGRSGLLILLVLGSGTLVWAGRRGTRGRLEAGLLAVFISATVLSLGGCSGKLPAQNPAYTGAGAYTLVVRATDGFLVHTTSYNLQVTVK